MLDTILKIIHPGNKRNTTNWDRYVVSLGLRTEPFKTRFLLAPFNHSPFTNMLLNMLLDIDHKFLLSLSSDFDRFTGYVDPYADTYRSYFDPVHNQAGYMLFKTQLNSTAQTYVLNIERDRPLHTLPMDKPWKAWEHLRTIRVLYHDSPELVTDLKSFSIPFQNKSATHVIIGIDIPATFMKWLKYCEHCTQVGEVIKAETFIQNFVYSSWFEDLRRIWITNILKEAMTDTIDIDKFTSDQIIAPNNMLLSCIGDVYKVVADAKAKNLRLNDFIATDWFGDYSIYDWMNIVDKEYSPPNLRQYTFMKFMSELPYMEIVVRANNMIGSHDSTKLNRDLQYAIRRYTDSNVFNNISNITLRNKIKTQVSALYDLTNKNPYL